MGLKDMFFDRTRCDRCRGDLTVRTMSWFTEETICGTCSDKERKIKDALKEQGKDPRDYEGCGHVPEVAYA